MRRDGTLAAVLPLERRRGELRSLSNWHTPSFGILAEDAGAAAEVARAALARRPRRLTLAFLRGESGDLAHFRAAADRARYGVIVRPLERSPYVETGGEWNDFESSLDGKMLRELRRRRRRLEDRGPVRLDVRDGREDLAELLEEGFRVEAAGWKGSRGTAIASDPATRRFYEAVADWAAGRGWLRLAFLRLDERAIAFDFCVEAGGVHYLLKTGYDPDFRTYAPGTLIRHEMIARAFASPVASYEFLGADEPWKLEWARDFRELSLLQAFAPSPSGRLDRAAWVYGRPLAKRALALARR